MFAKLRVYTHTRYIYIYIYIAISLSTRRVGDALCLRGAVFYYYFIFYLFVFENNNNNNNNKERNSGVLFVCAIYLCELKKNTGSLYI